MLKNEINNLFARVYQKEKKENESVIINWNIAYPFQSLNKLTVFLSLAVQWI